MAEAIGGLEDHVHLLISLKRAHTPADLVRELKKASSAWVAENVEPGFGWQEGYTLLSVSWTPGLALRQYLAGQEAHHRQTSFVDELRHLLERNGVAYDPKYLL